MRTEETGGGSAWLGLALGLGGYSLACLIAVGAAVAGSPDGAATAVRVRKAAGAVVSRVRAGWVRLLILVADVRTGLGLLVGGEGVMLADPDLSRLSRVMRDEETGRPVWTWADRPDWILYSDWARFVGTTDPLPSRESYSVLAGVDGYEEREEDEAGRPDPASILPDECPGVGCPDRYLALTEKVTDRGPAPIIGAFVPPGESGGTVDGWRLVGEIPAGREDTLPGCGAGECLLVYCAGCETPNPTFRVRCGRCGTHLATGERYPVPSLLESLADSGPADPSPIPAPSTARRTNRESPRWDVPSIKVLARVLAYKKRSADWTGIADGWRKSDGDTPGYDVRLQVVEGEGWQIWTGDSSYDTDHRGAWGAGYLTRRGNTRDLAADLIEQVRDAIADIEAADAAALASGVD